MGDYQARGDPGKQEEPLHPKYSNHRNKFVQKSCKGWLWDFYTKCSPSFLDGYSHYSFPTFHDNGTLEDSKLKDYKEKEWQPYKIKYKDFIVGKCYSIENMGHTKNPSQEGGQKSGQKVKLDYKLYDSSSKDVKKSDTCQTYYLCSHPFGVGFEKGIEDMKCGGVRRIIVPKELTSKAHSDFQVNGHYAIYDVQLHEVGSSFTCRMKKGFSNRD